jgi:hypothetical protein
VDLWIHGIVCRCAALARWRVRDVIDRDEELVALFLRIQRCDCGLE